MIIHKLIAHHLRAKDDEAFYLLQARDAISWIESKAGKLGKTALDLGCGHGIFGAELIKRGCQVTFADEGNFLLPEIRSAPFIKINLDRDDIAVLGKYDLVVCSNVLEHLSKPESFLNAIPAALNDEGLFYLSWTNWLSPWGGHEFSPFHYLGPRTGHRFFDRISSTPRKHTPYQNLFPTYIGQTLGWIRKQRHLQLVSAAPRYYPELQFLIKIPILREFVTWNCALLLRKTSRDS